MPDSNFDNTAPAKRSSTNFRDRLYKQHYPACPSIFPNTNNTGSITLDQSLPYIAPNALMAPYLIIGVWYLSLISLFFSNNVNCLLFPEEDSNALEMINRSAKCEPHPTIEVMMDHIVLNGKKLSTIKRLFPSHVIMHKCKGKLILDAKLKFYRVFGL